jgi:hypothetical protein
MPAWSVPNPQRHVAEHPVVAAEDVLNRVVERMAHVSAMFGGDDHRERLPALRLVAVNRACQKR